MRKPIIQDWSNYTSNNQEDTNSKYTGELIHEGYFQTDEAQYFITFYANKVYRLIKTTDTVRYSHVGDTSLAADRLKFQSIAPDFESWMRSQIKFIYQDSPF